MRSPPQVKSEVNLVKALAYQLKIPVINKLKAQEIELKPELSRSKKLHTMPKQQDLRTKDNRYLMNRQALKSNLTCALYKIRKMSKFRLVAQNQFYQNRTFSHNKAHSLGKCRKMFHSKNCKPRPIQNSGDTTRQDVARQSPRKPIKAATAAPADQQTKELLPKSK